MDGLALGQRQLTLVTMFMVRTNNNAIKIIDAITDCLIGTLSNGDHRKTRQLIDIPLSARKLFLYRMTCVTLGHISTAFPNIGDTDNICTHYTFVCKKI